jgi:hypothetical protein
VVIQLGVVVLKSDGEQVVHNKSYDITETIYQL